MKTWSEMSADERAEVIGYIRVAAADKSPGAFWPSVALKAPTWAAIADALSRLDALTPLVAKVAGWDWGHDEHCAHGPCPDPHCEGGDECEADGARCDCVGVDVDALIAALRPLVPRSP